MVERTGLTQPEGFAPLLQDALTIKDFIVAYGQVTFGAAEAAKSDVDERESLRDCALQIKAKDDELAPMWEEPDACPAKPRFIPPPAHVRTLKVPVVVPGRGIVPVAIDQPQRYTAGDIEAYVRAEAERPAERAARPAAKALARARAMAAPVEDDARMGAAAWMG